MTKEEAVKKIMTTFNFEKVNHYMVERNWKWHKKDVPSIEKIKETAELLMFKLFENNSKSYGTGGFTVRLENNNLSLQFGHTLKDPIEKVTVTIEEQK